VTYCLIHKVEAVLDCWSYVELIGSRTEEDRLRIQRATGTDIELLFDKLSEPIGPDLDLEHRLPSTGAIVAIRRRAIRRTCVALLGQGRMAYILNHLVEGILKIELNRPQKRVL
jgi:hypothetical protein